MNEKELILRKGEQPVAKIADEELSFLIRREFPNEVKLVKTKLNKVESDTHKGKNRISASILKLADKNYAKLDLLIKRANKDFRDIVSEAEYPRASSYGFGERDEERSREDYLKDWEEFTSWVKKK